MPSVINEKEDKRASNSARIRNPSRVSNEEINLRNDSQVSNGSIPYEHSSAKQINSELDQCSETDHAEFTRKLLKRRSDRGGTESDVEWDQVNLNSYSFNWPPKNTYIVDSSFLLVKNNYCCGLLCFTDLCQGYRSTIGANTSTSSVPWTREILEGTYACFA